MRLLLLLVLATASASAQPARWVTLDAPPCDALHTLVEAGVEGFRAYAGMSIADLDQPDVRSVQFEAVDLPIHVYIGEETYTHPAVHVTEWREDGTVSYELQPLTLPDLAVPTDGLDEAAQRTEAQTLREAVGDRIAGCLGEGWTRRTDPEYGRVAVRSDASSVAVGVDWDVLDGGIVPALALSAEE